MLTGTEIHEHTEHKSVSCKNVPTWALCPPHRSASKQLPTWRHTSSGWKSENPKTHGQQRWTCPFHNNVRESLENVGNHGGWTRHSYAVLNSTVTRNDERYHHNGHKHPDQKLLDSKSRPPFAVPFAHQILWRDHLVTTPSQLGDTRSRAPTLELRAKRLRWSFDSQHICWSPGQVCNKHPNTWESTDNKTHRITYRPTRKSTNARNANRSTLREKDFSNRALRKPHRDASRLKPTWWHTLSRSNTWISDTHTQQRWSLFIQPEISRVAKNCWQSWQPGQRTPMQENTLTMTHTSNHVQTRNGNPQTYEAQIALMQKMFQIRELRKLNATSQNKIQLGGTQSHAPKREFPIRVSNNAGRVLSSKIHACRSKKFGNLAAGPTTLKVIKKSSLTQIHQCTRQNQKSHTSTSKTDGIGIATFLCTSDSVATTSWSPWSKANLVASIVALLSQNFHDSKKQR